MKIADLYVADAHIQDGAWVARPIRGDAQFAFRQVVDLAIARSAERVIALGDLMDKPRNDPGPVSFLYSQIDLLREANIAFEFILGQPTHDPGWGFGHAHARHIHKQPFLRAGRLFYPLDFQYRDKLQEELALLPKDTYALLAHQGWSEYMGEVTMPQGSLAEVPYAKVVLSGDYHASISQTLQAHDGRQLTFISPGSTCLQDINEPEDKYVVAYAADGQFCRIRLKNRLVLRVSATTAAEADALVQSMPMTLDECHSHAAAEGLPDALLAPIVVVRYLASLDDLPRKLAGVLKGNAHVWWQAILPEEKRRPSVLTTGSSSPAGRAVQLPDLLPDFVDSEKEPLLYELTSRLLGAKDKEGIELVLDGWINEEMTEVGNGEEGT